MEHTDGTDAEYRGRQGTNKMVVKMSVTMRRICAASLQVNQLWLRLADQCGYEVVPPPVQGCDCIRNRMMKATRTLDSLTSRFSACNPRLHVPLVGAQAGGCSLTFAIVGTVSCSLVWRSKGRSNQIIHSLPHTDDLRVVVLHLFLQSCALAIALYELRLRVACCTVRGSL